MRTAAGLLLAGSTFMAATTAPLLVDARPPYLFQQHQQHALQYNDPDASATAPSSSFEASPDSHRGQDGSFGASHLSEWCRLSKEHFLYDVKHNRAQDWIVVTGNEAGGTLNQGISPHLVDVQLVWRADLDSLVSAVAIAYDLAHTKHNVQKAVALLQVEESAIDLRPENKLALQKAGMERGHKDLLGAFGLYPRAYSRS